MENILHSACTLHLLAIVYCAYLRDKTMCSCNSLVIPGVKPRDTVIVTRE